MLAGVRFHVFALIAQLLFYVISLSADRLPAGLAHSRFVRLATMFTVMNIALLRGFWRWAMGTQQGTWSRTARTIDVGVAR